MNTKKKVIKAWAIVIPDEIYPIPYIPAVGWRNTQGRKRDQVLYPSCVFETKADALAARDEVRAGEVIPVTIHLAPPKKSKSIEDIISNRHIIRKAAKQANKIQTASNEEI